MLSGMHQIQAVEVYAYNLFFSPQAGLSIEIFARGKLDMAQSTLEKGQKK